MDSFFPKTSNLGFFIACSSAVLATHTGVILLSERLAHPHKTVFNDPNEWRDAVLKAALLDSIIVAPALAAYSFYNQNKKNS